MNGSGKPFVGRTPITTPRLIMACTPISSVSPNATHAPNKSGAFMAMMTPRHSSRLNKTISITAPRNPNSSPMVEKIKSEYGSGR